MNKEGVLDSFVGRSGEGSLVVVVGFLTASFGLAAFVNLDRPISLDFFFFSSSVWDMKITILFGLLENFLIGNLGSSSHCSKSQRRNANFYNTARKSSGPVTVINWDPHKFSPDLNLAWIQK